MMAMKKHTWDLFLLIYKRTKNDEAKKRRCIYEHLYRYIIFDQSKSLLVYTGHVTEKKPFRT